MSKERLELVKWYAGGLPSVADQIAAHRKVGKKRDKYWRGQDPGFHKWL